MASDNDNGLRGGDTSDVQRVARLLLQLERVREQMKSAGERAKRVRERKVA